MARGAAGGNTPGLAWPGGRGGRLSRSPEGGRQDDAPLRAGAAECQVVLEPARAGPLPSQDDLGDALRPTLGYLGRLVERMDRTNLRQGDPKLYRLVRAAEDAMHSLCVELHYQSCASGVGRPPA
jgi:hypothetical protein